MIMSNWRHDVVSRLDKTLPIGDHSVRDFEETLLLLEKVIESEPHPKTNDIFGHNPWKGLDKQILQNTARILNTSIGEQELGYPLTKDIVLSVEPLLCKVVSILKVEVLEKKGVTKGLGTLLVAMQKENWLPESLPEDKVFISELGWENHSAFINVLKDIIPERLDIAHRSSIPIMRLWKSVYGSVCSILWHNKAGLLAKLNCDEDLLDSNIQVVEEKKRLPIWRYGEIGLPPTYIIDDSDTDEPYTTRQADRKQFLALIKDIFKNKFGGLITIESPLGMGKSSFILLTLKDLKIPTFMVNLEGCGEESDVVREFLKDIPLSVEELDSVSQNPLLCVDLIHSYLSQRSLIVIENADDNLEKKIPRVLYRFIRSFYQRGHMLLVETKLPHDIEIWTRIPSNKSLSYSPSDLRPLAEEEIEIWAERKVGRKLSLEELKLITEFTFPPIVIQWVLGRIARGLPTEDPDVVATYVLEASDLWDTMSESSDYLLDFVKVSPEMIVLLGAGPPGLLIYDVFNDSLKSDIRKLRELGLSYWNQKNSAWKPHSWLRLLAYRSIRKEPTLLVKHINVLHQYATNPLVNRIRDTWTKWLLAISTEIVEVEAKNLLYKLSEILISLDLGQSNNTNLLEVEIDDPTPIEKTTTDEVIPLETELADDTLQEVEYATETDESDDNRVEISAASKNSVPQDQTTNNIDIEQSIPENSIDEAQNYYTPSLSSKIIKSLPDNLSQNLLFYTLDSLCLTREHELFKRRLNELITNRPLWLLKDWRSIRKLQFIMINSPLELEEQVHVYQSILGSVDQPIDEQFLPSEEVESLTHGWLAKFISFAAVDAKKLGDDLLWKTWSQMARQYLVLSEERSRHQFEISMNTDTNYQIVVSSGYSGHNFEELARSHMLALRAIPRLAKLNQEQRSIWTQRALNHIEYALRYIDDDQEKKECLKYLANIFNLMPLNARFFKKLRRFYGELKTLPTEVEECLKKVLSELPLRLNSESQFSRHMVKLTQLWIKDDHSIQTLLNILDEFKSSLNLGTANDEEIEMAYFCLDWLEENWFSTQGHIHKSKKMMRSLSETLIKLDKSLISHNVRSSLLKQIMRISASHEVNMIQLDQTERSLNRINSIFNKKLRKIEKIYEISREASIHAPWRLVDKCRHIIFLNRKRLGLIRNRVNRVESDFRYNQVILDFLEQAELESDHEVVSDIIAIEIYSYLWMFDEFVMRAKQAFYRRHGTYDRIRTVGLIYHRMCYFFLHPPPLNYVSPEWIQDHNLYAFFEQVTLEYLQICGKEKTKYLTRVVLSMVQKFDQVDLWTKFAEHCERHLGSVETYWDILVHKVSGTFISTDEQHGGIDLLKPLMEDLTDPDLMRTTGLLLRAGSTLSALPTELRLKLAELSLVAFADEEAWKRSFGKKDFIVTAQQALSIGMALRLSQNGKVFGKTQSIFYTKRGVNLNWKEAYRVLIQKCKQRAVGNYRDYLEKVDSRFS